MKIRSGAALAALALCLAACGDSDADLNAAAAVSNTPLTQIPAPNNGNWTEVVTRTPQGTTVGNPDAPVKLIEYASMTCPACQAFTATGAAPLLETYVRSGQVSWEYRHLIIHGGPDVVLAMLSDCQPESAFFRTVEQIFAQQREILGNLTPEEQQQLQSLPPEQQLGPLARAMELDSFFARRGMPETRFNQCLANVPAVQQLADNLNAATAEGVTGTPTFFINGERQDASTWAQLEPRLRAAIGG